MEYCYFASKDILSPYLSERIKLYRILMDKYKNVLLLLLAVLSIGNALAIDQIGIAYRYNGKKQRTPLGGVYIKVATSPNGVVSQEQSGQFVLKLKNIGLGDAMGDANVQKSGMMVFNKEEVNRWHVGKDPLVLIVCDANEFQKQKNNLIAIGRSQAEKKYQKKLKQLKAINAKQQLSLDQYYAKFDSIEKERNNALAHMDEYADMFARIDESEIDTLAQRAIELFNQGQLEKSIKLFEQGNYLEKLDDAMKVKEQGENMRQKADSAVTLANKDIEEYTKSVQAQVAAYKMNNQWEKAKKLLKSLSEITGEFNEKFEYATLCYQLKYYEESFSILGWCQEAIKLNDSTKVYEYERLATIYEYLGSIYRKWNFWKESEFVYFGALEIYEQLNSEFPHKFEIAIAETYNNLGILYSNMNSLESAKKYFLKALGICKSVHCNQIDKDNLIARIKYNFGLLLLDSNHYLEKIESKAFLLQSFNYYSQETEVNNYEFAIIQQSLGRLYFELNRLDESEKYFVGAISLLKALYAQNPLAFGTSYAKSLEGLGQVYFQTRDFKKREKLYKEALSLYLDFNTTHKNSCQMEIAECSAIIANSLIFQKKYLEARKYLDLSFNNLVDLYNKGKLNKQNIQFGLRNLFADYLEREQNEDSLSCKTFQGGNYALNHGYAYEKYKLLLPYFKTIYSLNPEYFSSDYVMLLLMLSHETIYSKQFKDAAIYAKDILKIDSTIIAAYTDFAPSLLFQGNYQEAEKIYHQYKTELKDVFLSDFEEFSKAGIIPKNREGDVEKIKQLLLKE